GFETAVGVPVMAAAGTSVNVQPVQTVPPNVVVLPGLRVELPVTVSAVVPTLEATFTGSVAVIVPLAPVPSVTVSVRMVSVVMLQVNVAGETVVLIQQLRRLPGADAAEAPGIAPGPNGADTGNEAPEATKSGPVNAAMVGVRTVIVCVDVAETPAWLVTVNVKVVVVWSAFDV